jgi:hypothetical protein
MHAPEGAVYSSEFRLKMLLLNGEFTPSTAMEAEGQEKRPDCCPICSENKSVTYRSVKTPDGHVVVRIFWYDHIGDDEAPFMVEEMLDGHLMHPRWHQTFGHLHSWSVPIPHHVALAKRYLWKTYLSWSGSISAMSEKETRQLSMVPADDFLFPLESWINTKETRILFMMRSCFYLLGYPPGLEPGLDFNEMAARLIWFALEPRTREILEMSLRTDSVPVAVWYQHLMIGRVNSYYYCDEYQLPPPSVNTETGEYEQRREFKSIWTDVKF